MSSETQDQIRSSLEISVDDKRHGTIRQTHLYVLGFFTLEIILFSVLGDFGLAIFIGSLALIGGLGRLAFVATGELRLYHVITSLYLVSIGTFHLYAGPSYAQDVALLAFIPIVFIIFQGRSRWFFSAMVFVMIVINWATQMLAAPEAQYRLLFDFISLGAFGIILPRLYQIHFHQIRETETALNQTEDLFEQVMEQLPTIFWTKDLNGRYTRVNRMGLDFMSQVSEGILGRTSSEIHPDPSRAERLKKQDEEVIRTKETLRVPREQFPGLDGEDRWAIAIKAPIFNKEGEVQEIMGISTDITELVYRERELERAETFLAQALRVGKMGTFEFDYKKQDIKWSATMLELLGADDKYPPPEALARFVPADKQNELVNFGRDSVLREFEQQYSIELNGERRWFNLRCEKMFNEDGNPSLIVGVLQDISEQNTVNRAMLNVGNVVPLRKRSNYFDALVHTLGELLEVDYVYIGEAAPSLKKVVARSLYAKGEIQNDLVYPIDKTPTGTVLAKRRPLIIRQHTQKTFPDDSSLADADIESYIGIPLFDSEDKLIGSLSVLHTGVLQDVTRKEKILTEFSIRAGLELENHRLTRSLRQDSFRFHSLFERAPDALALYCTMRDIFVKVNKPMEVLLGVQADELEGRSLSESLADSHSTEELAHIRKSVEAGELTVATVETSQRNFQAWISSINIEHDEPYKLVMIRDLTKGVNVSSVGECDLFRQILDNSADLVSIGTVGKNAIYLNPAGRKILEWDESESALSKNLHDFLIPRDAQRVIEVGLPAVRDLGRWHDPEVHYKTSDGREIPMDLTLIGHHNHLGELKFVSIISHDIRRKLNRENQIVRSERRYRMLFENNAVGIMQLTPEGLVADANEAFHKMLGYENGELIGLHQETLIIENSSKKSRKLLEHIQQNKPEHYTLSQRYLRRDGQQVDARVSLHFHYDDEGNLEWTIATAIDLGEEIKLSQKAKSLKKELKLVQDTISDAVCLQDEQGHFSWVSPNSSEVWGWTPEELIERPVSEFIHSEDFEESTLNKLNRVNGGPPSKSTFRFRHKDGGYRWIQGSFSESKALDSGNSGRMIRGLYRDVTAQRKQEQASIIEQETYFNRLIVESPYAMGMRKFEDPCYHLVNKRFADMLGYSVDELISKDRSHFIAKDDPNRHRQFSQILSGVSESVQSVETIYKRKDGSTFLARVNRIAININQEKFIVGWVVDIDEERRKRLALEASEARYRRIFEANTVGIQECDLSQLLIAVEKLRNEGVVDFARHIDDNPDWLETQARSIRILDTNKAMLDLLGGISLDQVQDPTTSPLYSKHNLMILRQEIIALANKVPYFSSPLPVVLAGGEKRTLWFSVRYPQHQDSSIVTYAYTDVTTQEVATRALKTSEKRYRRLFESLNVGMQELDLTNVVRALREIEKSQTDVPAFLAKHVDVMRNVVNEVSVVGANRSMLELADAEKVDDLQNNADQYFDDEGIKVLGELGIAILEGRESYSHELNIISRKGLVRSVWLSAILPKDDGQNVIMTWSDISSLKRTEEALYDSEIRFRTIVENAQEIFVLADIEKGNTFVSPSFERLTGVPGRDVMGDGYKNIIHPEDLDRMTTEFGVRIEELKKGAEMAAEIRLKNSAGDLRWFDVRTRMLLAEPGSGRSSRILIVARDIHERERTRQALHNSERRFRLLFENGFDGILLRDANSRRIVMTNQPLLQMFGFSRAPQGTLELMDWLPDEQPNGMPTAALIAELETHLSSGEGFRREITFRAGNGKALPIHLSAYVLEEANSKIQAFIFKDISAQKRAEDDAQGLALKAKEVEAMGRELTSHTLHITQRNKLLGDLLDELGGLEKSFSGEAQQAIARLRRKVDRNMDQGESWLNFKLYFERVHPDFFNKLTAACPKLSTNELKHCAYIRMNMAPNEVAEMLFVERKTVEVSRYRIKKKLGLGKGVSLIEYIRGI